MENEDMEINLIPKFLWCNQNVRDGLQHSAFDLVFETTPWLCDTCPPIKQIFKMAERR